LIGGFAVNYYKVARYTADVDFLIAEEDFEKVSNEKTEIADYQKRSPDPEALEHG